MLSLNSYGQHKGSFLYLFSDTSLSGYGYKNQNGDTVIQIGKYNLCYTDTFKKYAIVAKKGTNGLVVINRKQKVVCEVFIFDNGPDPIKEDLFRIIKHRKIGYMSSLTGKIVIKPKYACAWPFINGVAKVSRSCSASTYLEHTTWSSNNWFYIDKKGKRNKNSIEEK